MAFNSTLGSATLNYQLTAYAQGLWNDLKDVIGLAERLAPTTSVPGATGQFKKFDDKNSFMPENTKRALGGDPTLIKFSATDGFYNCTPQALEVRIDKVEDQQAGSEGDPVAQQLLDQGKIAALMNKTALSHVKDVSDFVLANTTPIADYGQFSSPDIDPIDQINELLLAISQDVGSTQNLKLTMDLGVWAKLRRNAKVKARAVFGAATTLAEISIAQLNAALLFPCDIMVANVVFDTTKLGVAPSKKRIFDGTMLFHYSIPNATLYDPSAFKAFTVGPRAFTAGVRSYQAPNQLWRGHLLDWSRDLQKTSALSVRRMDIS
jgi:hypothetical protein